MENEKIPSSWQCSLNIPESKIINTNLKTAVAFQKIEEYEGNGSKLKINMHQISNVRKESEDLPASKSLHDPKKLKSLKTVSHPAYLNVLGNWPPINKVGEKSPSVDPETIRNNVYNG